MTGSALYTEHQSPFSWRMPKEHFTHTHTHTQSFCSFITGSGFELRLVCSTQGGETINNVTFPSCLHWVNEVNLFMMSSGKQDEWVWLLLPHLHWPLWFLFWISWTCEPQICHSILATWQKFYVKWGASLDLQMFIPGLGWFVWVSNGTTYEI